MGDEKEDQIKVSIVILTYNQEEYLKKSLPIIKNQITDFSFEIIAIVTDSTDNTERICKEYCSKIIKIKKEEFHHSITRNLAIKESDGEFIVFLVGDAIPADEIWLKNLISPMLESPEIVGIYSRQIPFEDAPVWEKNDVYIGCKNAENMGIRSFKFYTPRDSEITKYISFSNVSACYRTGILKKYSFNEKLTSCEDQEWCKRMLEKKFTIGFSSKSVVLHSHNHNLKKVIKRNFEFGENFAKFLTREQMWAYRNFFVLCGYIGYKILNDLVFLLKNEKRKPRLRWIIKIIIFRIIEKYAFYKGAYFIWKNSEKKK